MPDVRHVLGLSLALLGSTLSPVALAEPYDYGTPLVPSALGREHGELRFAFAHSFQIATFPSGATPTLFFEYGATRHIHLYTTFTTQQQPGDLEAGIGYQFWNEYEGAWASLMVRFAYSSLGKSGIAELLLAKNRLLPPLGMGLTWRGFTNANNFGSFAHAAGVGLTLEVIPGLNLYGDTVVPFDRTIVDRLGVAWSSGVQWWIPDTPHVLVMFLGVLGPGSTQGRTFSPGRDFGQQFRIGFEFSTLMDIVVKKKKQQGSEP